MGTYGIAIGQQADAAPRWGGGEVDTAELRQQLADIRDALAPVLEDDGGAALRLSSLEIGLTLSASGKVLFIAEAGVEATITLTFSRPA